MSKINRRKFLRNATLSTVGAGMASTASFASGNKTEQDEKPKIREYRKFGRTGFQVSDISSGWPSNEALLRASLDKGINLVDAGEVYLNGNSERIIGKVIQDYDRSSLFINSKLYTEENEFPSKKEVIERTNLVLERIQSDYVDCMQIHSAENSTIVKDKAFHSGMEQLKKEGKVRHVGISCHGNNWVQDTEEDIEKILMTAVDDGRFDVILLAYNFANSDKAERILEACDKKGIATMIMKSNPVYLFNYFDDRIKNIEGEGKEIDEGTKAYYDRYKTMYAQAANFFGKFGITDEKQFRDAASKYVLSNPQAHTTLWNFDSFESIDYMLGLSGQKLSSPETAMLDAYKNDLGHTMCRTGCNECEAACPHNLPVNKIMRYNYYFSVKKQEKRAMEKYAKLGLKGTFKQCIDCEGYCEKSCTYGVWTRPLIAAARQNLEMLTT